MKHLFDSISASPSLFLYSLARTLMSHHRQLTKLLIALLIILVFPWGCSKNKNNILDQSIAIADTNGRNCGKDAGILNWSVQDLGAGVKGAEGEGLANFFSIWGTDANNIYVVGSNGKIINYNGQTWQRLNSPTSTTLTSIYGTSATNIWATGFSGTVLHYDGTSWVDESPSSTLFSTQTADGGVARVDAGAPIRQNLWGVWVTVTSDSDKVQDVYVVGDRGTILQLHVDAAKRTWSKLQGKTRISYNTDGGATSIESIVQDNLMGIWGANADTIYIAGDFGTVLKGPSSKSFYRQTFSSGVTKNLRTIWGRSASNIFAAGVTGTVLFNDGAGWYPISGGPVQNFHGIWGPADNNNLIYLVGGSGIIVRLDIGEKKNNAYVANFNYFPCVTNNRLDGLWGTMINHPAVDGGMGIDAGGGVDASVRPSDSSLEAAPVPIINNYIVWACGTSETVIKGY